MDTTIVLDLYEGRLLDLETRIEHDVDDLLQEELYTLYWTFQGHGGDTAILEQELLDLVWHRGEVSVEAWGLVDKWVNFLFSTRDIGISNICRDMLYFLYIKFEQGPLLECLEERFEMQPSTLLAQASSNQLFAWFLLWLNSEFPQTSLFLFGYMRFKRYQCLGQFELRKVVQYIPTFMLWHLKECLKSKQKQVLLRHLAQGQNIRTSPYQPISFTKRMAHHFVNVPKETDFTSAIWQTVVAGVQGDPALIPPLRRHVRFYNPNWEYLRAIIRFFSRTDHRVEPEELTRLLGYLRHLWDEHSTLPINNWTLASLRRRSEEWYGTLNRRYYNHPVYRNLKDNWEGVPLNEFEQQDQNGHFKIVQLTSLEALFEEGKNMRHCVGTYGGRCQLNGVSIWSLRQVVGDEQKSLVTLEVSPQGRIVQIRTKCNGSPKLWQMELIKAWALREDLVF